jgi:Ketopantoate reductase PanE/ApbA
MSNGSQTPQILIVGAGAMGLGAGYHLHLARAAITFLVRPARILEMSRSQVLYSYDDATLKTFADYSLISDIAEISRPSYDYVIVTLDGFTTRKPEGTALLKSIGDAIRESSTEVIIGGIGIDLRDVYLRTMAIPAHRILNGALGMLCHQVANFELPLHAPTDPVLLSKADVAYRHIHNASFLLDDRFPEAARRFAAIYAASGVSSCQIMKRQEFAIMTKFMFPVFAACELLGWPHARDLGNNKEIWDLTVRSVREIQGFEEHGVAGKAAQVSTTADGLLEIWSSLEQAALPLDFAAFNKFHHGDKVRAQDVELLNDCVKVGEQECQPMSALKELLVRVQTLGRPYRVQSAAKSSRQ